MNEGPNQGSPSGPLLGTDTQSELTLDTVLELLANQRRRFCLYALSVTTDGILPIESLVEDVTTLEAALAKKPFTRSHYLEVASDLRNWHLEVLVDVGIVQIDEVKRTIQYVEYRLLETWLNRIKESELSC